MNREIAKLHNLLLDNAENTNNMCKFYCTQFLAQVVAAKVKFRLCQFFNKLAQDLEQYYIIDK